MRPYADSWAHLRDELRRIDLVVSTLADDTTDQPDADPLDPPDTDSTRPPDDDPRLSLDDRTRRRAADLAEQIDARVAATDRTETRLRFRLVVERFDLSRLERDALALALAPDVDGRYADALAPLVDDRRSDRPTVDVVTRVLAALHGSDGRDGAPGDRETPTRGNGDESPSSDPQTVLAEGEGLRATGLVYVGAGDGSRPRARQSVAVDDRIVEFLLGADGVCGPLARYAELRHSDPDTASTPASLAVDDDTRDRLATLAADAERGGVDEGRERSGVGRDGTDDAPRVVHVSGPPGTDREAVVATLAAANDHPRLRVDGAALAAADGPLPLDRLRREARLHDAALEIHGVDALCRDERPGGGDAASDANTSASAVDPRRRPGGAVVEPSSVDELITGLTGLPRDCYLVGRDSWTPTRSVAGSVETIALERPDYDLRRRLWEAHADELPEGVDPADLAATFTLTPGEIDDALYTARATTDGEALTERAVYRGCRAQSAGRLERHADRLDPTYEFDDIVLPDDRRRRLREVIARVRNQGTVYDDWGFDEAVSHGDGLSVLFSGASGTGKTMAAEIVANAAGLDLYRVDVSSVVSKYVGETEENLGELFDEAAHSDAVLLFDEADAIFGQRSEVSDAQDRYANVEVNYLLQRVEDHGGTVVLTTNYEQNVDDAFLRRLDVTVDFPRPGPDLRRRIWESVFPEATPVGDLDYDFLASFDVTGGNVENVAETAAFLAADDDGEVRMEHVVPAVRLELEKIGKLVDTTDFGDYRDLL